MKGHLALVEVALMMALAERYRLSIRHLPKAEPGVNAVMHLRLAELRKPEVVADCAGQGGDRS